MDVLFLVEIRGDTQTLCARTHHRPRGCDGFQHHIAQFTRTDDIAFAFECGCFNRQKLAADFRPRQPGNLSDAVFACGYAEIIAAHA